MTIVKAIEVAPLNGRMVFAFLPRAPFPEGERSGSGWGRNHRVEPLQYHPVSHWMDGKTEKQVHVDWSAARPAASGHGFGQQRCGLVRNFPWKPLSLGPSNMEEAAAGPCWSDLGVGSRVWYLS